MGAYADVSCIRLCSGRRGFAGRAPTTGPFPTAPMVQAAAPGDHDVTPPPSFARGAAPPSIVHLTTSLDIGGAQTMLAKLIETGARRRRHPRHTVISLMRPGPLAARLQACQCPVYDLGMRRSWPSPMTALRLLRTTSALEPDLLQGWMYHGNLAASLVGLAGIAPVVWNVRHSLEDVSVESAGTRRILALSTRLAHRTAAIIYNSRSAAAHHEKLGFPAARTQIIPNGFDCARFDPDRAARVDPRALFGIPEGPILVCMAARLHPMKDHAMLVQAVGRARQAGHDLHLLLVGPGLEAPSALLRRQIAATLPPERVTLVPERTDLSDWLAGVDIVALSSAWGEAFPNIVGEAMACGIPCVATDVGDCRWIVGEGGFVTPARDASAMADALGTLARIGAEGRRHIGLAGRARILETFSLEEIGRQYRRLYEQLLAGPATVSAQPAIFAPNVRTGSA